MNFISQLFVHDCQKIFSYILKSAIATIVTDNWLDKLCELFHLLLIHWKQWKWKQVIQSFAAVLIHLSNISLTNFGWKRIQYTISNMIETHNELLSYGRIRIAYKSTTPLGRVLNLIISILGHWDFNYMIVSSLGFITTKLQLQWRGVFHIMLHTASFS